MNRIDLPEIDLGGGGGTSRQLSRRAHAIAIALERAKNTVPVVNLTTGQIVEVHVPALHNGKPIEQGDQIVIWANGEYQVAKRHQESFELYADWCTKKQFAMYRELMEARARGVPIRVPDPSKLYPKKLLEHRAKCKTGNVEGKAWLPGEGIVDDPEHKLLKEGLRALGGIETPEGS